MNEDNGFEYLFEEQLPKSHSKDDSKGSVQIEENNEFINGLPEWDLEPPYEVVRRQQL